MGSVRTASDKGVDFTASGEGPVAVSGKPLQHQGKEAQLVNYAVIIWLDQHILAGAVEISPALKGIFPGRKFSS